MCVLLVEDEAIIMMATTDAIEATGLEVLSAFNGPEALGLISDWPGRFTALVTDFRLPGGMTGGDVVTRVRQDYPTIPIIVATGSPFEITEHFCKANDVHLVRKPFDPVALSKKLESLLAA